MSQAPEQEALRAKLNAETAKLRWPELEPHFARGAVIVVDPALDLVQVAECVVADDKKTVAAWLEHGQLRRAEPDHAEDWRRRDAQLWAVVTAPWVLVQEMP